MFCLIIGYVMFCIYVCGGEGGGGLKEECVWRVRQEVFGSVRG